MCQLHGERTKLENFISVKIICTTSLSNSFNFFFQGVTRMLLTKIPFYKDVILISFACEHCGYHNNEIQSGGKIEEKGIRIRLNVEDVEDLNRTIVKSDFTAITIPELEFEIPSGSQKGGKPPIIHHQQSFHK